MKFVLNILVALLIGIPALLNGQTFPVEAIRISGDIDKKINIVVLSEGYQETEFDKFVTDVTTFSNHMFSTSPFLEYADYFNVYIIKVPSNESGADHPFTATDVSESGTPVFVDTYFNATFDAFGYHRYLYYGIDYADAAEAELKIYSVLADNFPEYDQALLFVNSPEYGGTGGVFPVTSAHTDSKNIAIHELGHSLFNLKDEYLLPDVYYSEAINMTQDNNTTTVKWKNWINDNGINVYQHGTSGVPASWYRPHQSCKMRYLASPFCSVCKEGMIEKIHELTTPINSYLPNNTTVDTESFPINFELNLTKPNPNTLKSTWTLNGSEFANNVDGISITENDLIDGTNTLTTVVIDDSHLLRIDNHENTHAYTVTWTINHSTLGITNIETKTNKFDILLFPNPANTLINFKFEGDSNQPLKIDITNMNGKKIKSIKLSNLEEQQIDISSLKSGVYLTHFYSGTILIASKKLLKN